MSEDETLKSDGELDIATANHILNLEVFKLCRESQFLHYSGVFPSGKSRVLLRLGSCAHHLPGAEDEGSCPRLSNSHDDGRASLGVKLGVPSVQSDLLEVQLDAHVNCAHDVLQLGYDVILRGLLHCRGMTHLLNFDFDVFFTDGLLIDLIFLFCAIDDGRGKFPFLFLSSFSATLLTLNRGRLKWPFSTSNSKLSSGVVPFTSLILTPLYLVSSLSLGILGILRATVLF